ncbi:nucleoside phosphorylase [Leeuwenhoekiella parthenopeia]|uniref:Uridine phosphorylase n=1 Tax=Leeuwenhoekiella parthenopeia TaxID=2890320 RepID=A0ABS8GUI6_9FLAO|nr:nucleoside phosphorylase [Leeuwenhoekiella parthenopeia]MCC4213674.1 nucleoside phosphorylase [Leeuwenhoekiella parthenopeia]
MPLASSELILNEDQSIYHLHLKPENLADVVITVGDPDRVAEVSRHFEHIEISTQKREFKTETGTFKGKRISVISTGIGTDNIDIVLNELDALVNIDFETREIKEQKKSLQLIRLGTSGAIQSDIPVDSILLSKRALGFDSLLHFYQSASVRDHAFEQAFSAHLQLNPEKSTPYCVEADSALLNHFKNPNYFEGTTVTNVGFYGPQGRTLRLQTEDVALNEKLQSFRLNSEKITNLEMETSGIYGLSKLLDHRALSVNAILANRATGKFSKNPSEIVERMITEALERIAEL